MPADSHAEKPRADDQVRQLAEQLLATGFNKLSERECRVITGVAKRTQISRDVNRAFAETQTLRDRLADRVASFGGSWTFIIMCLAALVAWTAFNAVAVAWQIGAFDPYPFIFLNLILSMLAALQAPVILMSQNRQAARDRLAAGLDYEVNLKAEIEIIELHTKLDQIRSLHLDELLQTQRDQLRLLMRLVPATGDPAVNARRSSRPGRRGSGERHVSMAVPSGAVLSDGQRTDIMRKGGIQ